MSDHPDLFGYYNNEATNADEVNGGGVNLPVSPMEIDSFIGLNPLIVTADMMAIFAGCPDIVMRGENSTYVVQREPETLVVRKTG